LITDFSSIYLDFILTGKPIIFNPFGFESYLKKDRELYYSYEDVTIKPYCYDWSDVMKRLIEIKNNVRKDSYDEQYEKIKDKFHDFALDGKNSERLLNLILKKT
jgi:CDP-glycerol glycerophosphotransferase